MDKRKYATVKINATTAHDDVATELEELRDELQEWYDNMPESLQSSDKGSALEDAISALEDVISTLQGLEAPTLPEGVKYDASEEVDVAVMLPRRVRRPLSRADRRDNACASLEAAATWYDQAAEALFEDGVSHDLSDFADALRDAQNEAEEVEFPSMFG